MQLHEFEVRPLQPADFDVVNESSELFIEFTKLGLILARILDVYARRLEVPFQKEQASTILVSLKQWINDLPERSRLYPLSGRRIYRRDVYEIHVCYFTTLITFFHLCGQVFDPTSSGLISLVASSCMAQLYEEMRFRDDVNFLMSPNNWYLMVACVPQIHYAEGEYDQDGVCARELNILIRILQEMCLKWPGAKNILDTVLRLSASGEGSTLMTQLLARRPAVDQDQAGRTPGATVGDAHGLFPFPPSMCPRMNLLDRAANRPEATPAHWTSLTDQDLFSIFDLFNSNPGNNVLIDSFQST
ncbi:uncharacterized protein PV07_03422 [Cladophialophora immunda]|uniref:Transcription factor domain-containing protein n=1 Tax=Cladophialophora immunda TaxID=569365 RepID=A0A0D2D7W6_9EURO|nr:uncharacterized protein PV07_03422 [Cladophialophora immunda]KIW31829.1 hypothetical protein PV07_03422 [Cladophialophora immunda]